MWTVVPGHRIISPQWNLVPGFGIISPQWNLVPGFGIISPQGRPQGSPPHIHTTPAPTMIRIVVGDCQSFGDIQVVFIFKGQASYASQWNSRGVGNLV